MSGPWSPTIASAALRRILVGRSVDVVDDDCSVLDVTGRRDDVLVTFRWMEYPFTLGLGIGQVIPYTVDAELDSPEEWANEAWIWLQEQLGTGVVARASRVARGDFIELVTPDRPDDQRFYLSSVGPDDDVAWDGDALWYFEAHGFDTAAVRAARADGTLLSWVRAYVNNRRGSPYVSHAAVARTDATTAQVFFCDVVAALPGTVLLDLCLLAAHEASWQGALRVQTTLDHPALDSLGFRQREHLRELTTEFFDVDHDVYRQLRTESRRWRQPRSRRPKRLRLWVGT